jgi:hypothetical protein
MPDDQYWARVILAGANDDEGQLVIETINELTASKRVNRGSVMIACVQMLGQAIADAPPDVAREVRAGIMALIDGYAMKNAVLFK